MDFKANDQVMVKRRIRTGNLVRMGEIVRIDGDKAQVHFPLEYSTAVIPVDQLQPTSQTFGTYNRVQASAVRRGIYPVRRKA